MAWLSDGEKSLMIQCMFNRFNTITVCDGQVERQTDRHLAVDCIVRPMCSIML